MLVQRQCAAQSNEMHVPVVVNLFLMADCSIVNLALIIFTLCLGFDVVTHCMV